MLASLPLFVGLCRAAYVVISSRVYHSIREGLTMPFRRSFRIAPGVRLNLGRRGLLRFPCSIRLAPGIRLNIGNGGLSTSLGGHVTVGRNTRATISAPGRRRKLSGQRQTDEVVTVVIWADRLLGAAVMMALLFLWTAGWL
jgi:Protein of unknown function (DUF4236)